MSPAPGFLQSTIGKKVVMAVSGLVLFGFVFAHMLGNLQVYLGPTKLDEYGAALRHVPVLLWGARAALLLAVAAHTWAAWSLTRTNWKARPIAYQRRENVASTYASRTMRLSAVWLLLFIVYHLLHFTTGTAHPSFVEGAVNHNFVSGFRSVPVSLFYILAMLALGLHLYHGVWSLLQTLGLSHPRYDPLKRIAATTFTLAIVVANVSFPIAVLAGWVGEATPPAQLATTPEAERVR